MITAESGAWNPLPLSEVVKVFRPAGFRWWISGGHALELHLGRSWRDHRDIDVGVARGEVGKVRTILSGWDIHVATGGQLAVWTGQPLDAGSGENNLWCRRAPEAVWCLDITIAEGDEALWIFRRDTCVRVPWREAVLETGDGVPYLAPELQLLYKSKGLRTKDNVDAAEVIPALAPGRADRLARLLPPAHPWLRMITKRP